MKKKVLLLLALLLALFSVHFVFVKTRTESDPQVPQEYLNRDLSSIQKVFVNRSGELPLSQKHSNVADIHIRSTITVNNKGGKKPIFVPLPDSDVSSVQKFVLFVGYPRSGHSIIASMMDGHPDVVIAHEYNLFAKCSEFDPLSDFFLNKTDIFNALYRASAHSARSGWRSNSITSKGYNLHTTEWHGTFHKLKVIGDKSGGRLAKYFYQNYTVARACYRQLSSTVQVPILFIHVVRNPFDMIATGLVRKITSIEDMRTLSLKKVQVPLDKVQDYVTSIFHFAEAVSRIKQFANVYEIHLEDFIRDPKKSIWNICTTLDLPCPTEYIDRCYEKAYKTISKSRHSMEWDPVVRQRIEEEMNNYNFFSRYSFDGN